MASEKIHHTIYVVLLAVLAAGLPTSNFLMNAGWVLLFVNWLAEWDMKAKWQRARENRLLQAFLLLYLLHAIGLLWSADLMYGLDDMRKKLPMLAVPLVMLTTPPPSKCERRIVMKVYVAAIVVATAAGFVRWLSIDGLPYREIIPFISHIRFSLNLSFGVCLMCVTAWMGLRERRVWLIVLSVALAAWFIFFLLLLQSFTGIATLYVAALVALLAVWKRPGLRSARGWLLGCWLALLAGMGLLAWHYVDSYYRLKPPSSENLRALTAGGRPYTHANDGFIENGNYVNNYICDSELRSEWPKVGHLHIDSLTPNGYPVYPTLVRYLNAMGYTKDSVGVGSLKAGDIEAIESGIANPVYRRRVSLKRMCYVMCFEHENWRHDGSVVDFTVLQRLELWRAGLSVFKRHWLFGVGTGDVVDECHAELAASGSSLAGTTKHTHSQYLTFLITFGVCGCGLLLFAFGRALPIMSKRKGAAYHVGPLLAALIAIVLVSFITEDTLETLAGCLFAVFLPLMMRPAAEAPATGKTIKLENSRQGIANPLQREKTHLQRLDGSNG